ncbi:MAG: hypothetical protein KIS67_18975 [Verrucomicrobiae bacterium]|nr:hypothetical protein [Verrucomicrobiae bacterium]
MSDWCRCEILLPSKFNDGQPVPRERITEALLELEQRFGAVSCETQIIHGIWRHQGQRFRDDLIRVFVDMENKPEHREFFTGYKEQLKARFKQLDLWITIYPIDLV